MDELLEILYRYGAGDLIDSSRAKLLYEDEIYHKDLKDLDELENKYENLPLPQEHRMLINDYLACMNTIQARSIDCSYMAGLKDAILIFHTLDLIKPFTPKEKSFKDM